MANLILILGESGTGKSTSIENLDEKSTFIVQVVNKPLPFKGFKQRFPLLTKENPKGNRMVTNKYDVINWALNHANNNLAVKTIIVDDFQYLLADEFMARANERGYDKFIEIAQHYYQVIKFAEGLREDLNTFFLSHSETTQDGNSKVKTIGKLLDEKITVEGLFTIVLNTKIEDGQYFFETQNSGFNTTKSPRGMFDRTISNDLKLVTEKINEYYGG